MKDITIGYSLGQIKPQFILDILNKHYNLIYSNRPQFYFYSVYDLSFLHVPEHTIKIFCASENTAPDFNWCDYAIGLQNLTYKDRYFHYLGALYEHDLTKDIQRPTHTLESTKRKFCNYIYANPSGRPGGSIREEFCKALAKYKHVDCPGFSLNNMSNSVIGTYYGNRPLKLKFVKDYKFTIAFENSYDYGYITEKIYDAYVSGSVPIYYGAPDIDEVFNPDSFIDCRKFKNFDEAIEYIKYIDKNDNEYLKILNAPIFNDPDFIKKYYKKYEDFIRNMIENPVKWTDYWTQSFDVPASIQGFHLNILKEKIVKPILESNDYSYDSFNNYIDKKSIFIKWPPKDLSEKFNNLESKLYRYLRLPSNLISWSKYFNKNSKINNETLSYLGDVSEIPPENIIWKNDAATTKIYKNFFNLISPGSCDDNSVPLYEVDACAEGRIGCILSVGVSVIENGRYRDYICADHGFPLIQYDPTLSNSPKNHENLKFYNSDFSEITNKFSISQQSIIENTGEQGQSYIFASLHPSFIDLIDELPQSIIDNTSYLYIELFDLLIKDNLLAYLNFLNKLSITHHPVRLQMDKHTKTICFNNFMISDHIKIIFKQNDTSISLKSSFSRDSKKSFLKRIKNLFKTKI